MKMILITAIGSVLLATAAQAASSPACIEIDLDMAAEDFVAGDYARFEPAPPYRVIASRGQGSFMWVLEDGKYVSRPNQQQHAALRQEAYPYRSDAKTCGSWDAITAFNAKCADGGKGMGYFSAKDIENLRSGTESLKPCFCDSTHSNYYQSVGANPNCPDGRVCPVTKLWKPYFKSYQLKPIKAGTNPFAEGSCDVKQNRGFTNELCPKNELGTEMCEVKGEQKFIHPYMCDPFDENLLKALIPQKSQRDPFSKALGDTSQTYLDELLADDIETEEAILKTRERSEEVKKKVAELVKIIDARLQEGGLDDDLRQRLSDARIEMSTPLSRPIINKQGNCFSAATGSDKKGTNKIYCITEKGTCKKVADLGVRTSKPEFSHDGKTVLYTNPSEVSAGWSNNTSGYQGKYIHMHDIKSGKVKNMRIADEESMSYPGFLCDGRITYMAKVNGKQKVRIVDPAQLKKGDNNIDCQNLAQKPELLPNKAPSGTR